MPVGESFRTLIAKTFNSGIRLDIAKEIYFDISTFLAKKLSKIYGIEKVLLRGGMLKNIVPGYSDIDFTLISSNSLSLEQEVILWEKIYKFYHGFKKTFPVLGEIQLFTEDEWNLYKRISSEDMQIFDSHFEYYKGDWKRNFLYENVWKPSKFVRFLKSFVYYKEAISFLSLSRHYKKYLFNKNIRKCHICSKSSLDNYSLVSIFVSLDKLAKEALKDKLSEKIPIREISDFKSDEYIVELTKSEFVLNKLKINSKVPIYLTKIPFYYLIEYSSYNDIDTFFIEYELKKTDYLGEYPIFISKDMYRILLRAWSRWWPNVELDFPFFRVSTNEDDSRFQYISLLNRVTNIMIGIFSSYIFMNRSHNTLYSLLLEIMNLLSPKFSRNKNELIKICMKENFGLTNSLISLIENTTLPISSRILCLRKIVNNIIK